jgi:hypothetical protein
MRFHPRVQIFTPGHVAAAVSQALAPVHECAPSSGRLYFKKQGYIEVIIPVMYKTYTNMLTYPIQLPTINSASLGRTKLDWHVYMH